METLRLQFYEIGVEVRAPAWLLNDLRRDFSFFAPVPALVNGTRCVVIEVHELCPPFDTVPAVRASLYQPDSISYDQGEVRYVDYNGKALSIFDYGREEGRLYAQDRDLLHELSYLLIHSRVGELLDKKGFHRVHALGLVHDGNGLLCLLPQGGGKTTLALELLGDDTVQLLSDDTPLVDRRGRLLPFPLRIGIEASSAAHIPERFRGTMVRRKYGAKTLIDIEYFQGRVASGPVPARYLLVGEREFADNPRLTRIGRCAAAAALFKNCVVGLGLPQMVEYFLRHGWGEMLAKGSIAISRLAASLFLVMNAETYRLVLGRRPADNAAVVRVFLKRH